MKCHKNVVKMSYYLTKIYSIITIVKLSQPKMYGDKE